MIEFGWLIVWTAFIFGFVLGIVLGAIFRGDDKNSTLLDESLPPASEGRHRFN